jgi:hypothetical protein
MATAKLRRAPGFRPQSALAGLDQLPDRDIRLAADIVAQSTVFTSGGSSHARGTARPGWRPSSSVARLPPRAPGTGSRARLERDLLVGDGDGVSLATISGFRLKGSFANPKASAVPTR